MLGAGLLWYEDCKSTEKPLPLREPRRVS